MKKEKLRDRMMAAAVMIVVTGILAGCGTRENLQEETVTTTEQPVASTQEEVEPALWLGDYKGLSAPYTVVEITEEMLDQRIRRELKEYTEYEQTEEEDVAIGSIVSADVEIWYGESLIRTRKDQVLTVASSEDYTAKLAGSKKGNVVVIGVKYSDDYEDAGLCGKKLEYRVKVNTLLKELPFELNDEFVRENTEYWQVEQYREAVREELLEEVQEQALLKWKQEIQRQVIDGCIINEYPQERLNYYKELHRQYDTICAQKLQKGWDDYLLECYYCSNDQEYEDLIGEEAYKAVKTEMILKEIAAREEISISEKEIDDFKREQCEKYGFLEADELEAYFGMEIIETAARSTCIWNWIYRTCKKEF